MKYFKSYLSHLWVLLALAISLGSCSPESNKEVIEDGILKLNVTMPEAVNIDGAKGAVGYYWNPELTLFLQVTQEGATPQELVLKPKHIQKDGSMAYFEVPIKVNQQKPFSLVGAVYKGDKALMSTGGGAVIQLEGFGGLLPFDLIYHLPHPLLLADQEVSFKEGEAELSTTLSPLGKMMLLEWHNSTDQTITLQSLTFKSSSAVFPSADNRYDTYKKEFSESLSETSVALHTDNTEAISPDYSIQYLYWLPVQEMPSDLELTLNYQQEGKDEASLLTSKISDLKGSVSYRYLSIQKDGTLSASEEQQNIEADTSGGGDPHFSMNDIKFWVGEGSKRAALVIEWHDGKEPDALVWGYRFDGDKTGMDMLRDIVAADPHLSIVYGEQWGGFTLASIGYQFKATDPRAHILLDGKPIENDGKGSTIGEPKFYDKYTFSDSNAHYLGGFYTNGYWVYYTKDNRLDSFAYSNVLCTGRMLQDGAWDGWSFQHGMSSFSGNPHGEKFVAAPLPESK